MLPAVLPSFGPSFLHSFLPSFIHSFIPSSFPPPLGPSTLFYPLLPSFLPPSISSFRPSSHPSSVPPFRPPFRHFVKIYFPLARWVTPMQFQGEAGRGLEGVPGLGAQGAARNQRIAAASSAQRCREANFGKPVRLTLAFRRRNGSQRSARRAAPLGRWRFRVSPRRPAEPHSAAQRSPRGNLCARQLRQNLRLAVEKQHIMRSTHCHGLIGAEVSRSQISETSAPHGCLSSQKW